jgi:hypothetical protein
MFYPDCLIHCFPRVLTHGRYTDKGRRNTRIQSPGQSLLCDRFLYNVHGSAVYALLRCLHAHLDQVERVSDDDGANSTYTSSYQCSQRLERGLGCGLCIFFELCCGR